SCLPWRCRQPAPAPFPYTTLFRSEGHRGLSLLLAVLDVVDVGRGELVRVLDVNAVEQVPNRRGGHWWSPLSNVLQSGAHGRVSGLVLALALELPPAALAAVVVQRDGSKAGRQRGGLGKTECPPVLRVSCLQVDSRPTGRPLALLVILAALLVPLPVS